MLVFSVIRLEIMGWFSVYIYICYVSIYTHVYTTGIICNISALTLIIYVKYRMSISHKILGFGVGRSLLRPSSSANSKVLAGQGLEPRYFNPQLSFLEYIVEYIKRSL